MLGSIFDAATLDPAVQFVENPTEPPVPDVLNADFVAYHPDHGAYLYAFRGGRMLYIRTGSSRRTPWRSCLPAETLDQFRAGIASDDYLLRAMHWYLPDAD